MCRIAFLNIQLSNLNQNECRLAMESDHLGLQFSLKLHITTLRRHWLQNMCISKFVTIGYIAWIFLYGCLHSALMIDSLQTKRRGKTLG